jgi:hypothetical protein
MAIQEPREGLKERLDDIIKLARQGHTVTLDIQVYRNLVKQISRSESTDDIDIETDLVLLMADFIPTPARTAGGAKVTKVYAVSPLNESEIDEKTTCHIANQRLKMDFSRLKDAGVKFEEKYF